MIMISFFLLVFFSTAIGQRPLFADASPNAVDLLDDDKGLAAHGLKFLTETPADPDLLCVFGSEGSEALRKVLNDEGRLKIPWMQPLRTLALQTHGLHVRGIREGVLVDPANKPFITLRKNLKGVSCSSILHLLSIFFKLIPVGSSTGFVILFVFFFYRCLGGCHVCDEQFLDPRG